MALRLRRDVQKASYYVWFLGAEEAKGLRGSRIINSVLPYLIDRSRGQEPLKVTLQVSHKGIKILQGSSKHFIPHSAITSSVQTDDIVACVLLLYNPATKCPLHVHAYRCDSESTAEALHQQLQILINRPENQRRFEELENRLGIMPPMATTVSGNNPAKSSSTSAAHSKTEHNQKQLQSHTHHQQQHRRLETSPKRFSSSLGSDTGNSTRESECSEEHSSSPVSRSPPMIKTLQQPPNELFDSLAAELRAKLNGNGPPILLPPRDYDTVHRSKGNLTAIELRRCRNKLIVGSTTSPTGTMQQNVTGKTASTTANVTNGIGVGISVKQISSRGSSGIGSDLAPSPERQDINSSSDDDRWSNEADNSVIALKPPQIPMERSALPITSHHPHSQLSRKSALQIPEDSYLRDLPVKPYNPQASNKTRTQNSSGGSHSSRDKLPPSANSNGNLRSKTPSLSATAWTCEDEIKPIIMRPADYDAKFNRMLLAEQKQDYKRNSLGRDQFGKLKDTEKYNKINRLLNKKHTRERDCDSLEGHRYNRKTEEFDDFDDSDPSSDNLPANATSSSGYRKENLTDKQKFIEYSAQKQTKTYASDEQTRYGGRRYVDPADPTFEKPTHNKYAAIHRGTVSPERSDLGHRTTERQRERQRVAIASDLAPRRHSRERELERENDRERVRERERFSHSSERNPYREPESIPYIESMEKMMKSTALCYKSFDGDTEGALKAQPISGTSHTKVSQHTKSYPKYESDRHNKSYSHNSGHPEYPGTASSGSNISPKERFKDAKTKFHAMERSNSRYDLNDDKNHTEVHKPRHHGSASDHLPTDGARIYDDWSDEEQFEDSSPPPVTRSRSRSRDNWDRPIANARERSRNIAPVRNQTERESDTRDARERRDYSHDVRARELPGMRAESREIREHRKSNSQREQHDSRRDHRYDYQEARFRTTEREINRGNHPSERPEKNSRDHSRDYIHDQTTRRDYTPDRRTEHRSVDYIDRSMEKQRVTHSSDKYPPPAPTSGAPIPNAKAISNIPKGYRHSYAEPVFARSAGRVGLAAVNPF